MNPYPAWLTNIALATLLAAARLLPRAFTALIGKGLRLPLWAVLSLTAATAEPEFTYTTDNGAITITRYTGAGRAVIVPEQIDGMPVTGIGDVAFFNGANVTNVVFQNGVRVIGSRVFLNCTGLVSVTIPATVVSIGDFAFSGCQSLAGVSFPNSLTSIGNQAFEKCASLVGVTIPPALTSIGAEAFID
jgi:hypothetical protein